MNGKFLLYSCVSALLAAGLGFGVNQLAGLPVFALIVTALVAAFGAFAAGRAFANGALREAGEAVCAVAANPSRSAASRVICAVMTVSNSDRIV